MNTQLRVTLAFGSVAIIAAVNATAAALGPPQVRLVLLLFGIAALVAAVQCALAEPGLLTWALVFSLPPVITLLADGSPTWLVGPLAALLLVAAELSALSRELPGTGPLGAGTRRRLLHIGQLGALGLVAALAVGAMALGTSPGGTVAVVVAATALAILASVVFGRGT